MYSVRKQWHDSQKKAVSNILRTADIKLCKLSVYQELAGELETSRRVLANTWHKKVEKLNLSDLKIYCISLSDSQARRQEILEMKNKFGLSLEFVDAIDGRSCSKEEIQASTEREIRWNSLNGYINEIKYSGEAACSLSHIKAWEAIIDEGVEQAIIIEDDVFLRACEITIPIDAEFVFLSTRVNRNHDGEASGDHPHGSEAYYLTNSCARKLLEIMRVLVMPVDIQWLPQIESLIADNHIMTEFTNKELPTFTAYVLTGIFGLSHHSSISLIPRD